MGKDCINIISMHSARRGLEELAPRHRSSYLQKLIEGASPDICFMPGDNGKCLEENVVVGYEQYRTPNQENTVLLYDTNRVRTFLHSQQTCKIAIAFFRNNLILKRTP